MPSWLFKAVSVSYLLVMLTSDLYVPKYCSSKGPTSLSISQVYHSHYHTDLVVLEIAFLELGYMPPRTNSFFQNLGFCPLFI